MKRITATSALLLLSAVGLWAQTEIDGLLYKLNDADKTAEVSKNASSKSEIVIPASVKYGNVDYAVTSIGSFALAMAPILTVSIPTSVTSIGYGAFFCCTSLTGISFSSPSSVKSIGESAFNGCSSLTGISIPSSVTSIGDWAFYKCSSLTKVSIPSSVTSIGESVFDCCTSLTKISIPSSVTSIGYGAFNFCTSLTGISFSSPSSVTSIGESAFRLCHNLTDISIPTSVTSIGERAFYGCSKLASISISKFVTSIGKRAFTYCSSLESITVDKDNSHYSSDSQGILYNKAMTTLVCYPDGIESISAHIQSWVTNIGDYAFEGCSLTYITIPSSVTSIGNGAFEDCYPLSRLTCETTTPPTVGTDAFSGVSKDIRVIVPHGTMEAYKKANGWSSFTNFVEAEATAVGTVQADKGLGVSGRVVSNPEGAVVVR